MSTFNEHPHILKLKELLVGAAIDRRELSRTSTLLGLSAASAYSFAGTAAA